MEHLYERLVDAQCKQSTMQQSKIDKEAVPWDKVICQIKNVQTELRSG